MEQSTKLFSTENFKNMHLKKIAFKRKINKIPKNVYIKT